MANPTFTQEQVNAIVAEAFAAARRTAEHYFHTTMQGRDQFPCGFASTQIHNIKGNTRLGKMLTVAGVRKNTYAKAYELWNPSQLPVQNVDCLAVGARAAADVFKRYGFEASAWSRLD